MSMENWGSDSSSDEAEDDQIVINQSAWKQPDAQPVREESPSPPPPPPREDRRSHNYDRPSGRGRGGRYHNDSYRDDGRGRGGRGGRYHDDRDRHGARGGGRRSGRGRQDWKSQARASSFIQRNDGPVDGSSWMATRRQKQQQADQLRHEQIQKQKEEEQQNQMRRRSSQLSALKAAVQSIQKEKESELQQTSRLQQHAAATAPKIEKILTRDRDTNTSTSTSRRESSSKSHHDTDTWARVPRGGGRTDGRGTSASRGGRGGRDSDGREGRGRDGSGRDGGRGRDHSGRDSGRGRDQSGRRHCAPTLEYTLERRDSKVQAERRLDGKVVISRGKSGSFRNKKQSTVDVDTTASDETSMSSLQRAASLSPKRDERKGRGRGGSRDHGRDGSRDHGRGRGRSRGRDGRGRSGRRWGRGRDGYKKQRSDTADGEN